MSWHFLGQQSQTDRVNKHLYVTTYWCQKWHQSLDERFVTLIFSRLSKGYTTIRKQRTGLKEAYIERLKVKFKKAYWWLAHKQFDKNWARIKKSISQLCALDSQVLIDCIGRQIAKDRYLVTHYFCSIKPWIHSCTAATLFACRIS